MIRCRYVVTGANSGCGLETSRQLAKQGATVILACRNAERGEAVATEVNGIFLTTLDLSSLQSIRDFVKVCREKYDHLDGLVNNAGIMACPYAKTKDGFEMQEGCNHLGRFLLVHVLTPMLLKTAETTGMYHLELWHCPHAQQLLQLWPPKRIQVLTLMTSTGTIVNTMNLLLTVKANSQTIFTRSVPQ